MSSSEDDEYSEALRDAIDSQFINDDMFKERPKDQKTQTSDELKLKALPSLRHKFNEDDQFETFGTTSEFRNFISNKLSNILDKKLQKRLKEPETTNETKPRKRKANGIRLFKDSTVFIKKFNRNFDLASEHNAKCRAEKCKNLVSKNESKCREVAVDPTDILNKTAVKHWSNRSKAEVFRYKRQKNGTLSLIE